MERTLILKFYFLRIVLGYMRAVGISLQQYKIKKLQKSDKILKLIPNLKFIFLIQLLKNHEMHFYFKIL